MIIFLRVSRRFLKWTAIWTGDNSVQYSPWWINWMTKYLSTDKNILLLYIYTKRKKSRYIYQERYLQHTQSWVYKTSPLGLKRRTILYIVGGVLSQHNGHGDKNSETRFVWSLGVGGYVYLRQDTGTTAPSELGPLMYWWTYLA